jgi:glutaredoxin-related protein
MTMTNTLSQQDTQLDGEMQEPDYEQLADLVGVDAYAAAHLDDLDGEELENFIEELDDCKITLDSVDIAKQKLQDLAKLKRKLNLADQAPRCTHIKSNGIPCRSAAMKGEQFCYFHGEARAQRETQKAREIPVLDSPEAVQLAIMRVCSLLATGTIEEKTARALFQGLRLAQNSLTEPAA